MSLGSTPNVGAMGRVSRIAAGRPLRWMSLTVLSICLAAYSSVSINGCDLERPMFVSASEADRINGAWEVARVATAPVKCWLD